MRTHFSSNLSLNNEIHLENKQTICHAATDCKAGFPLGHFVPLFTASDIQLRLIRTIAVRIINNRPFVMSSPFGGGLFRRFLDMSKVENFFQLRMGLFAKLLKPSLKLKVTPGKRPSLAPSPAPIARLMASQNAYNDRD